MRVVIGVKAFLSITLAVPVAAPAQTGVGAYEKKTYSYAEWAKGHFSEVVTVSNPAKLIYKFPIPPAIARMLKRWERDRSLQSV